MFNHWYKYRYFHFMFPWINDSSGVFKQFIVKKSNIMYFMVKTSKLNMYSFFSSIFFSKLYSSTISTSKISSAVVIKLGHDLVSVCPHMKENYKYHLSPSEWWNHPNISGWEHFFTAVSPFCGTIRHESNMYTLSIRVILDL